MKNRRKNKDNSTKAGKKVPGNQTTDSDLHLSHPGVIHSMPDATETITVEKWI